ncbi:MAG TPA: DUF4124 domain-containing protein [Thiobacillaceae bacterium]
MRLSNSLLALVLLLPPAAVAGPVYRHVDDQGNVSYSDQPPAEGSAEVELPDINRYSGGAASRPGPGTAPAPAAVPGGMPPGGVPPPGGAPPPPEAASAGGTTPPAPLPALAPIQYQSLVISGVTDGAILMNPEGSVSVSAAASPAPRADHRIVIRHNGAEVGDAGFYQAPRLDRGTHTFSAAIVDAEGNVLFQAADVSIHVQRPTLKKKKP